jgi:hypothetical protein
MENCIVPRDIKKVSNLHMARLAVKTPVVDEGGGNRGATYVRKNLLKATTLIV